MARRNNRATAKREFEHGRDPDLWPDSASRASNPLREAHEILLAGARLQKRSGEQRDIWQEVGRQYVQVETEVEIQQSVSGQSVIEHLCIDLARHFDRNDLVPTRQVLKSKRWNSGQRLWRVGGLLQALERTGRLD